MAREAAQELVPPHRRRLEGNRAGGAPLTNFVCARTSGSLVGIQPCPGPAFRPSAASESTVPSLTSSQLCCRPGVVALLCRVTAIVAPAGKVRLVLSKATWSPSERISTMLPAPLVPTIAVVDSGTFVGGGGAVGAGLEQPTSRKTPKARTAAIQAGLVLTTRPYSTANSPCMLPEWPGKEHRKLYLPAGGASNVTESAARPFTSLV